MKIRADLDLSSILRDADDVSVKYALTKHLVVREGKAYVTNARLLLEFVPEFEEGDEREDAVVPRAALDLAQRVALELDEDAGPRCWMCGRQEPGELMATILLRRDHVIVPVPDGSEARFTRPEGRFPEITEAVLPKVERESDRILHLDAEYLAQLARSLGQPRVTLRIPEGGRDPIAVGAIGRAASAALMPCTVLEAPA